MKKISLFIVSILVAAECLAQSGAVKKSADAVFVLTTFQKDGSILSTSNGVFVDSEGTAVSPWQPFVGAASAVVVDSKGNKHEVDAIVGANGIYDVAKFKIKGRASAYLQSVASTPTSGQQVWIVPNKKSASPKSAKISGVETFMDKYSYYILNSDADEMQNGCPVVDDGGKVLGILNSSTTSLSVTDIGLAKDFTSNGMAVTDGTLRQTDIRIALPTDEKQAQLALMLASDISGTDKYAATVDEFIKLFPKMNDGYYAGAVSSINRKDYAKAENLMQTALKVADKADEAHYNYARIILLARTNEQDEQALPASWTFDKAISETKEAYDISPQFLYQQLEAQILYAKGEYQQAYDKFMELTRTPYKNGDLFYQAMLAKARTGGEDKELLSLLDSAIAVCDTPYTTIAAPYFLERAMQHDKMENYRSAMLDFYRYEAIMYPQLSAEFYYTRGQSELRGKLFQPALNDISHAIALDPGNALYWAELASLNLRVKKIEEAIVASEQCIKLAPESSEAYLILGISQAESGRKEEGLQNMAKAKELGNEQADKFMEKYK